MSLWTNLTGGLRALFHRRESEREMDEELRAYLDAAEEQKVRRGMSPAEAQRAARVEMGSMESVKEGIRGVGWETAVESLARDVRYAFRVLAGAPVFTAVVVLTLALGIGANTAIFSLIDSILLRSLPVQHPEQLVEVTDNYFSNALWEQVRDRQDVFSGVFAWSSSKFNLARSGVARMVDGIWVSGDFFRTLGVNPVAGRLLSPADDQRGCAARAVISHGFWESHYGGAASAIGSTITVNGVPFEVIGVTPAGFFGMEVGSRFDVGIPICSAGLMGGQSPLDQRSWWWLRAGGRPKPGIGTAQLKARLAEISPQIYGAAVPQNYDSDSQARFRKRVLRPESMATGLSGLRKQYEQPLHILMAVVGLVLLIACANIAGLMLARAASRGKEMAMRQALGASRWRLMRQLIIESVLLSLLGALLGLGFARWGNAILLHYLSTVHNQVFLDFSLDTRVIAFTSGIALLTGLLCGVAPAFRGTRVSLGAVIKEGPSSDRGVRGGFRLWIVASQVALSLVLLVTAGLLLRSFWNLATLDIGFDRNHVLLVRAALSPISISPERYRATYDAIESALRQQPAVVSAAGSVMTPLSNGEWNTNVQSDAPNPPAGDDALAYFNFVSPSYFETMRTPLLAGRNLNSSDTANSTPVAVIDQVMARRFFPGLNPIGRTFRVEGEARKLEPPVEVVGVVKDAKYLGIREGPTPTVFRPICQVPAVEAQNFEVRTAQPETAMTQVIQKAVDGVNKEIPIEIHPLAAQVDDSMRTERVLATLAGFFGALALVLAMIGLYGTLSYLVTQRRVEFGIRMALGAQSRAILGLVMRSVMLLLAVGIGTGVGLSLLATKSLGALLFGLQPRDSATLAVSAALLAAVSAGASLLAARRATKVDPMVALRHE